METKPIETSELVESIEKVVQVVLERHLSENVSIDVDKVVSESKIKLVKLFNSYSEGKQILNAKERDRLLRLSKRSDRLRWVIDNRDKQRTEEMMEKFGDNYVDYAAAELAATEWAIEFIKEHSV